MMLIRLDNQEFIDYIGDILIELLDEKGKRWYSTQGLNKQ